VCGDGKEELTFRMEVYELEEGFYLELGLFGLSGIVEDELGGLAEGGGEDILIFSGD